MTQSYSTEIMVFEQKVLGRCMRYPDAIHDVVAALPSGGPFSCSVHNIVWDAMRALYASGAAIDLLTTIETLGRTGLLDKVGGRVPLVDMQEAGNLSFNLEDYCKIVRESAAVRQLMRALADLDHNSPRADIIAQAETAIMAAGDILHGSNLDVEPIGPAMTECVNRAVHDDREKRDGLSTPLPSLNRRLGLMEPGHLILIGGPPSMGKTSLLIGIARKNYQRGKVLLYISLDETKAAVSRRIIVNATGVSSRTIRRGQVDEATADCLGQAAAPYVAEDRLFITDKTGITVATIATMARRIKRQHGLDGVLVDYLQQIRPADPRVSRTLQVGRIAQDLKQLAKSLSIPVIALSQLHRGYDLLNANQPPRSTMLRDSGELEQEANIILFPWVPEIVIRRKHGENSPEYQKVQALKETNGDSHPRAIIVLDKGKEIETGEAECRWDGPSMKFYELDDHEEIEQ